MANTTISVSKRFRDWLKSKGLKGESYEKIIQKLLKPEVLKEYQASKIPSTEESQTSSSKEAAKEQSDIVDDMFGGKLT